MNNASRIIETVLQQTQTHPTTLTSAIIPESFWLGGLKIDVVIDDMIAQNKRVIGEANYATQQIRLDPGIAPLQSTEQAFIHELVHWIFFVMNEDELRNNERIVDTFAHFLYQALVTSNFILTETAVSTQEA